jgi:outer membrane protein OmpA-like peptidoglycan-associated protein
MIEFDFSGRRRPKAAALSVAAALGALLWASGPVAAEDAANPNVIVDDSALDSAGGGATGEVLPAPARQPVSRLVTAGQSAIEAATPPETTSETTYPAVPTTPIESTGLDGSQEPSTEAAATPAAGEAPAGEAGPAPAATAESTTPAEGSAPAAAADTQTAEGTPTATEAAPEQTAARPPIDGMVRLTFEPESRTLSDAAKSALAPLLEKLKANYMLRLQILAYAGGDDDAATHARGVSLARALAMRDYLTAEGITVERMEIKALGNAAQEEPADRIDLVPLTE